MENENSLKPIMANKFDAVFSNQNQKQNYGTKTNPGAQTQTKNTLKYLDTRCPHSFGHMVYLIIQNKQII